MDTFQKYFLVIILFSLSCSSQNDEFLYKLQDKVKRSIEIAKKNKQKYSTFKLSSITSFKWDKFYIFDEFTTEENINEITGLKWAGPDVPSGCKRILFISNNEVVSYSDFDPSVFPVFFYTCEATEQYVFDKKDDRIATFEACDKNGCVLAIIPERCIDNFKRLYQ
ncbi:hypothetical protein [Pedobacter sp. ASV12]|uniref:hypothetical protein n=1 Tax=Pedobacter sp. ASV12 TaxID=2795120 RepID=UPI0018EE2F9B|nr:hypothetical protein [Pedobacter sp. ASV12]